MKIKAYAKVNIFLKIIGTKGGYHLISSRFIRLRNLYDEIEFVKKEKKSDSFELIGDFGCPLEKNTIYKAYDALLHFCNITVLKDFFQTHIVTVKKKIPEFAGLGGGSSDGAYFMILANEVLDLGLSKQTLAKISSAIGADFPFFIYDYKSANVTGTGEIVTQFAETPLNIITHTPATRCDTAEVYGEFRKNYLFKTEENKKLAQKLSSMRSEDILKEFDPQTLNDLLAPALTLYPDLGKEKRDGWYFSGSGSTFFRMESL